MITFERLAKELEAQTNGRNNNKKQKTPTSTHAQPGWVCLGGKRGNAGKLLNAGWIRKNGEFKQSTQTVRTGHDQEFPAKRFGLAGKKNVAD